MQCFACCVHGAAVATRAAILRLWGQLYDACVDLCCNVVSLAMDTSMSEEEAFQELVRSMREQ